MTFPRNVGQIPIHYDTKPGCRPQSLYKEENFRWCSRYTDGEKREVSFTIDEEMLSFYRKDMTWGTEPGEFEIFIGGTSDADQSIKFMLK